MTPGTAGEPAAAGATDEPTSPQTARKPTSARVAGEPTSARVAGEPTSARVAGEPTTAGTAGHPAAATTVGEPTTAGTAGKPAPPQTAREPTTGGAARELVAAAVAGDRSAFAALTQRYRRELHVHCYRMLASFDDAEDAVQEAFLRAWRGRDGFDGGTMFRAWLYRIATNVCLDMLRRRAHRATVLRSFAEVPWLQPYPDRLLDEATAPGEQPDAAVIERETIELAFVAALQVLPPRQRATLIARDVLGWPASQTAVLLEMSVAAANSALQRARATMREHLPAHRSDWSGRSAGQLSDAERDLLHRFIDAHQRCDAAAAVAIAAQDIRITMPPYLLCYDGVSAMGPLLERALGPDRDGDWRLLPTAANRMPAAASYLRRPGDSEFRAFKLDVLRTGDGVIAEITTFGASLFPAFGLPGTLGWGAL